MRPPYDIKVHVPADSSEPILWEVFKNGKKIDNGSYNGRGGTVEAFKLALDAAAFK